MKKAILALLVLCATFPMSAQAGVLQGMGELVSAAAEETVKLIPPGKHVIAVSWFTFEGAPAGISDLLSGSITTALANRARGKANVVSRQATDRILAETEFQMSDLVDAGSQVRVGRQVGADLILTGSLVAAGSAFILNGQLIAVETGVVLGGFILNVRLENEFASRMSMGSEVIRIEKRPISTSGVATTTRVLEDFSGNRNEVQLSHEEWFDGPAVLSANGSLTVEPAQGPDGSPCARFSWTAALKTDDVVGSWGDSYLTFCGRISPGVKSQGFDGLSLSVKPIGACFVSLVVLQNQRNQDRPFGIDLFLNEGAWQDLKIPFALFKPLDGGTPIDGKLPFTVRIEVPYDQNWSRFRMRTGKSVSASVLVDNIGLYQAKSPDPPGLVESFDDEITRAAVVPDLYGAARYSEEADASGNGADRPTPGVKNVILRVIRRDGGPAGRGLSVSAHVEVNKDLLPFLDKGFGFTLVVSLQTQRSWKGFSSFDFFARSNVLTRGALEYQDMEHEISYSSPEIDVNDTWTRIRLPFQEMRSEDKTLVEGDIGTGAPRLVLYFDLPAQTLRDAVRTGSLDLELALDNLQLE